MILSNHSEYFSSLCGANSKWRESSQSVIELHDDDPDAAERVLRYLYGFVYPTCQCIPGFQAVSPFDVAANHINVFVAAQKYLLPKLESQARRGLQMALDHLASEERESVQIDGFFDTIKLLVIHTEVDPGFVKLAAELIELRLPELFKLPEFRDLLNEEPWKDALELCEKAIERDHKHTQSSEKPGSCRVSQCNHCHLIWPQRKFAYCPGCGRYALFAKQGECHFPED